MARFSRRRQGGSDRGRRQTAVVIGRWADDTALLRVEDGTTREIAVPEPLREYVDVGSRATVGPGGSDDVEWVTEKTVRPAHRRFWQRSRT